MNLLRLLMVVVVVVKYEASSKCREYLSENFQKVKILGIRGLSGILRKWLIFEFVS